MPGAEAPMYYNRARTQRKGGQRSAAWHTYQYGTTRQTKERKEKAQEKEALMADVTGLECLRLSRIDACILKPRYNRRHEHFEG